MHRILPRQAIAARNRDNTLKVWKKRAKVQLDSSVSSEKQSHKVQTSKSTILPSQDTSGETEIHIKLLLSVAETSAHCLPSLAGDEA